MAKLRFDVIKKDSHSRARLGILETAHGAVETPVFMPVATRGSVKALTNQQLIDLDTPLLSANLYHLMIRPGINVIAQAGGLHAFMDWKRPILTDSGGFQIFSLAPLAKTTEEGVLFQSYFDGAKHFLGPKKSMQMQSLLGSDIVMPLDQTMPYPCDYDKVRQTLARTHRWAEECRAYPLQAHQNLFGIIQGGCYADLRLASTQFMTQLDFEGFAIGGLSVGLPNEAINEMIDIVEPHLPAQKPRYVMGMGTPRQIIEAVMRGIHLFDCVMPTRQARHGTAFTWSGKIQIKSGRYASDFTPLDPLLNSQASKFSKAYLRHLLNVHEITGLTLISLQNLAFYLDFMRRLRQSIQDDTLHELYRQICQAYPF